LLLLHGVGSHERDLLALASKLDPRFLVLSLRAPFPLGPGSFAWFELELSPTSPVIRPEQAEASRARLAEFIPAAIGTYHADGSRVYLLGFSQGAIMSLALALTQPDLIAGVAAISGRTLPELFQDGGPLGGKRAPGNALEGLPILILHGTEDHVLPVAFARDTRRILQSLPVDLTYEELPMGHTVAPVAVEMTAGWITRQLDREAARQPPRSTQAGPV
jgi:phospholipase/carboxylesterase